MSEHKMGHVQDFRIYLNVLLGLMGLTVATVLVSLVDFGIFNTLVALFVACIKASLVILFFMHGKYESKVTWAFVWYPIFLLATLVGALFLDYGFRAPDSRAVIPASYDVQHPGEHGEGTHEGAADHADAADHSAPAGYEEDSHVEEPEVHAEDVVESDASASDHEVTAVETSAEAACSCRSGPLGVRQRRRSSRSRQGRNALRFLPYCRRQRYRPRRRATLRRDGQRSDQDAGASASMDQGPAIGETRITDASARSL